MQEPREFVNRRFSFEVGVERWDAMAQILAFAPQYNSEGKKDATGAFIPEAKAFVKCWADGQLVLVDNRKPFARMAEDVLTAIEQNSDFDTVAFFCHGTSKKLQLGFSLNNVHVLAKALDDCSVPYDDPRIVLYACSAGSSDQPGGDGGFADILRDELCLSGRTHNSVDAHTTVGHATKNPYVRRFEGGGTQKGGMGGYYLVTPNSNSWKRWVSLLKATPKNETPLRFEFPFLEREALYQILEKD